MLKGQGFGSGAASVCHLQRPLLIRSTNPLAGFLVPYSQTKQKSRRVGNNNNNNGNGLLKLASRRKIKATLELDLVSSDEPTTTTVAAKVIVKKFTGEAINKLSTELEDDDDDDLELKRLSWPWSAKPLKLQFVSTLLDPSSGSEKLITIQAKRTSGGMLKLEEIYEASCNVPSNFEIGAVIVENHSNKEKYVKEIELTGLASGPFTISCNSWVQPNTLVPNQKRVFFANKSYLPSQTPPGLEMLRETELANLRGNGTGERQSHDRIYDYDVYNDLGDPVKSEDLKRPVLGGPQRPYPRRCRTGRPHTKADEHAEERPKGSIYVPRDEAFSCLKNGVFYGNTLLSVLHTILPGLAMRFDQNAAFHNFREIDALFDLDGFKIPHESPSFWKFFPWLAEIISETGEYLLRFQSPEPMKRDKFFWLRDEEFARQTLAGPNPSVIQLVKEWPLRSQLDPEIYGCPESAFNTHMVNEQIGGSMTVEEAIQKKKLFVLDYHDVLLPYVQKVRALKGTTLYGSRTLFFLNDDETLRPLAIELTRPPMDGKPQWKRVYGPSEHATSLWLWRFAKAHVLAHDAGYHQLVSHWLNTHCAVEPYAIATIRQLSAMHPIYRLLHPHFRYTMEINAAARSTLVNAGGIIESTFTLLKYSLELSSEAYDLLWRFDLQPLPADLIHRGLAEEDPTAPHGLKLHIKDYPYANDGLILWDAMKQWVTEYVNHYYPDQYSVMSDKELQAWWTEIRTVGHGDKQEELWWPYLNTPQDLIGIVSSIAWVASAYHAAVNFGQYAYAGYFPSRPSIIRTNMPTEDTTNSALWKSFYDKPEEVLLNAFPSEYQATKVLLVMNVLSSHSPDEEYLGKEMEPSWGDNPVIKKAFDKFNAKMKDLESLIDHRNADYNLKNRTGAGVTPYELLKPFSRSGVTGKGVPYSVSI